MRGGEWVRKAGVRIHAATSRDVHHTVECNAMAFSPASYMCFDKPQPHHVLTLHLKPAAAGQRLLRNVQLPERGSEAARAALCAAVHVN